MRLGGHVVDARAAVLSAPLALVVVFPPLLLGGPMSVVAAVAASALIAGAAVLAVALGRGRTLATLGLVLWCITVFAVADVRSPVVVLTSAVAARAWAGVPEALQRGRSAAPDLLLDLVGGAAAAGLVGGLPDRTAALAPSALVVTLASMGVLLAAAGVRLRGARFGILGAREGSRQTKEQ